MKIPYTLPSVPYMPFAMPAAAACALVAGLLSAAPTTANAAIVGGSTVQFVGTAQISAAGDIDFTTVGPAPVGSDAGVRISTSGNAGSFAGYDVPNPASLPIAPNYIAGFTDVSGGLPPAGTLIFLPEVVIGGDETGPAVGPARFVASTWLSSFETIDSVTFFNAVAQGTIFDDSDGTSILGTLSFSTQNFDATAGAINSFSATLDTTVIPVPAAAWMLGSGLLAMVAASRRRKS